MTHPHQTRLQHGTSAPYHVNTTTSTTTTRQQHHHQKANLDNNTTSTTPRQHQVTAYWHCNIPGAHGPVQLGIVAPARPYCPARHSPEHADVLRPVVLPYVPAGHCVVQVGAAVTLLNKPRPQGEQASAPAAAYCPAGHIALAGVDVVDPAGQA